MKNKNKKNKFIRKLLNFKMCRREIAVIFLVLALFLLFFGLYMFYILGFHAMDLSRNEEVITKEIQIYMLRNNMSYNMSFGELTVDYKYYDFIDVWLMGIRNLLEGFALVSVSCFMIGYCVSNLRD